MGVFTFVIVSVTMIVGTLTALTLAVVLEVSLLIGFTAGFALVLPFLLYGRVASNRDFDLERYEYERGRGRRLVDGGAVVAGGMTTGIPSALLVETGLSLPFFESVLLGCAAALVGSEAVFVFVAGQFYEEDVNPWLSTPILTARRDAK